MIPPGSNPAWVITTSSTARTRSGERRFASTHARSRTITAPIGSPKPLRHWVIRDSSHR
ncbi:hypothetical protein KTR9_2675 [Gordonia sp. KTR9]|nr:hypothetical protein KTR9_2675 [Gordonia sp. KTR9]